MEFDEIVIGSGLTGLATAMGLDARKRVSVLAGPALGRSQYYDPTGRVLCAHLGMGGLGSYWHGVIPTTGLSDVGGDPQVFERLFARFYPRTDLRDKLGNAWLFVPWRPIRPPREWPRLVAQRDGRLQVVQAQATSFEANASGVAVHTDAGTYRGQRVWVCAGALHTPPLLDRSFGVRLSRPFVADHIICYLGQVDRSARPLPRPRRTADGVWFGAYLDGDARALLTLRPARFDFANLDQGIEQRAVFGLPTGSVVAKLLRRASPGLIAEALYNRSGLFGGARMQSVHAQISVADAYSLSTSGEAPMQERTEVIRAAADGARARAPWPELLPSRRPEVFIPAIHLHHSVDVEALRDCGANLDSGRVQVVDASVARQLGPEHHSFKIMVAAFARAQALCKST